MHEWLLTKNAKDQGHKPLHQAGRDGLLSLGILRDWPREAEPDSLIAW